MVKTSYDPEADVFAAWFALEGVQADRTSEVAPGIFIDFSADGRAVGIEILGVRGRGAGTYGDRGWVQQSAE